MEVCGWSVEANMAVQAGGAKIGQHLVCVREEFEERAFVYWEPV